MCLKGTIQPTVGAVCPICTSTVERILEVLRRASSGIVKCTRNNGSHK